MLATIHDGDVIIVDKITSHFRAYERGDVVVFVPPGQDVAFIKRII
jgi:signal peptidase I